MMGTGKSPVRVKQEQEHEVNLAQPGRRVQGRAVVVVWCGVVCNSRTRDGRKVVELVGTGGRRQRNRGGSPSAEKRVAPISYHLASATRGGNGSRPPSQSEPRSACRASRTRQKLPFGLYGSILSLSRPPPSADVALSGIG